jgi:hypothetical protein
MDRQGAYEEELEDISEKQILLEIMAELKSIRYGLQTGQFEEPRNPNAEVSDPSEPEYACLICGEEVKESKRKKHLEDTHNAPGAIGIETEFEQV